MKPAVSTAIPGLRLPIAPRSIQKGGTLKDLLAREAIACLAHNLSLAHPAFDGAAFERSASDGLGPLGILDRGQHLAEAMRRHLPAGYADAVDVLLRSLTPPLDRTSDLGMGVFFYLPHVRFIATYGLDDGHDGGADPFEVSMTVTATAIAALVGRIVLARFADQIDVRITTAAALLLAACSFTAMGLVPEPAMLVCGSIAFGLTVGNVTTLSPIIVRREFGSASFGAIFGVASCGIQLVTAVGPSFYGLLRDAFGGYHIALILAAALDILAAGVIVRGGRVPLHPPA